MFSVGIDSIEIKRIEKSMKKRSFLKYILGENEYNFFSKNGFAPQSIAANFCSKEAFSKCIGTGIRNFSFSDVQVLRDDFGKPYFKFSGNALKIVDKNKYRFSLSITHTKKYATAVAICFRFI